MADTASTPAQTLEEFLRVAQASGLVESNAVDEAVAPWKSVSGPMPEECVRAILDRGLLTPWQMDQLRKGRHKGFVLGKYRLLRLLGTGGMSSVYLAEHMVLRSKVAIKVLPLKRVEQTSYLERFEREARASARLNHPHIAHAVDLDTSGAIHFIVMEYIEGIDLHARVKQDGPLPVREAAEFIRQAALGLQHAHEEGLVHRDIKPANLMVDKRGHLKILDMGLALATNDDEEASLTREHDEKMLGTADYLAPEQAKDSHKADERSDIYSLGCTLYYLLVGKAPFAKGSLVERIRSQLNEPAPNLLDVRPDVPPAIVELYFRMMEKNPDARQQSAQEVADALKNWLGATGTTAPTAVRQRPAPPRRDSLRRTADTSTVAESLRRAGSSGATLPVIPPPSSGTGSGAAKTTGETTGPASGVRSGSGASASGSAVGGAPRSGIDLHSLVDTPPPSSGSRSTGRLPPVSSSSRSPAAPAPAAPIGGFAIDTGAGPGKGIGGGVRKPAVASKIPPQKSVTSNVGLGALAASTGIGREWLGRRYAGLPLVAWLAAVCALAVMLAAAGWLLLGRSGEDPGNGSIGSAESGDESETSAVEERPAKPKAGSTTTKKKKQPSKTSQRSPTRDGRADNGVETSVPSPLDNLDKLKPTEGTDKRGK